MFVMHIFTHLHTTLKTMHSLENLSALFMVFIPNFIEDGMIADARRNTNLFSLT